MHCHKSLYLSDACKYRELPTRWFCQNRIYIYMPHTAHMWIPASSKTNPATRCSKCEPICQHQKGSLPSQLWCFTHVSNPGIIGMSQLNNNLVTRQSSYPRLALLGKLFPKFLFLCIKIKAVFHVPGKWGRGSRQETTACIHTQIKTGSVQDRHKKEPGLETEHLLNEIYWTIDKFE